MVWKVNSISLKWERKFHEEIDPLLNDVHHNYAFFGPSVYHEGNLHWLSQHSGVIVYNLENEYFDLLFVNVPGDLANLDEFGFRNCTKKNKNNAATAAGTSTSSSTRSSRVCNCRFLGECGGKLAYARVTVDSQFFLWILEDYQSRLSSHNYRVVEKLPGSFFDGRVLAFENKADFVLLSLKNNVFWYNSNTTELKKVHEIVKEYDHNAKCEGFLVPYKLPRDNAPITPRIIPVSHPSPPDDDETARPAIRDHRSTPSSLPMDRLFYHYAVPHLAAQFKLLPAYDELIKSGLGSTIPSASLFMCQSGISIILINGHRNTIVIWFDLKLVSTVDVFPAGTRKIIQDRSD
ncbi:hypothetical protein ACH5RR_039741 [Cinchona calisaya]|uniref:Uncharacterized protein n=1 Tax=Cinchona calisaya TaxID=153742 RepID=A0ABD2Y0G1_9GENT